MYIQTRSTSVIIEMHRGQYVSPFLVHFICMILLYIKHVIVYKHVVNINLLVLNGYTLDESNRGSDMLLVFCSRNWREYVKYVDCIDLTLK